MELNVTSPAVEKSAEFKEEFFGMGNLAVVMTILRSKLYSNPIKTVVQEILSNARDAHREVGTSEVPVEVSLPNQLNPNFEVKDFGPGITPERMSDVFLQYGASTKRQDNLQTGGFGLGAKSPFSYTDSFVIESITDGKKRVYVAYIDETSIGKMSLTSVEETTAGNGTTIKIPVRPEDFYEFEKRFRAVTEYWDVRPSTEESITYSNFVSFQNKQDFFWFEDSSSGYIVKVLVDKIPYVIQKSALYDVDFSKYPNIETDFVWAMFEVGFCFEVPCGELTVSANRENIEINERNLNVLFRYFNEAKELLSYKFQQDIDLYSDFLQAMGYLKSVEKVFKYLAKTQDFTYRGIYIPKDFRFNFEKLQEDFATKLYEGKSYLPKKIEWTWISNKAILQSSNKTPGFIVFDNFKCYRKKIEKLVSLHPGRDFIALHPKNSEDDPKAAAQPLLEEYFKDYGGINLYEIFFLSDLEYDKAPRAKRNHARPERKELEEVYVPTIDGVKATTEDILKDPEYQIYYICTRYSKVITEESPREFEKAQILYYISQIVRKSVQASEKIAIFSCNQKTFKKFNTPENDIVTFLQEKISEQIPIFEQKEIFRSWFNDSDRPVSKLFNSDSTKIAFWQFFEDNNTVNNVLIKNLIKGYNKIRKFQNSNSEIFTFLQYYGAFIGWGSSRNDSTFFECLVKTFESYPFFKHLNFNIHAYDIYEEGFAEYTKLFSEYINLIDKK